ncbi:hypothetical protein NQ318_022968 [Aromia moschata]|uniref:Regulatory protein zeste n=1 Tax=Aromia moschata TaxID=1265417 RepID=A0AAV8YD49_9CUCU|nr:hypothetical protein NQ318_022968 [Aromia moschata]
MNSFKRAANFNNGEEALLVSLVNKYKEKIECRKTDMMTNAAKMETSLMRLIVHQGNKKKFAEEKCSLFGIGGGPPEVIDITPIDQQIKDILGVRIEGLTSELDDDAMSPIIEI